ncbi:MAG: Ig-like domain-containing protein, partial [Limisphaerales bacterium]
MNITNRLTKRTGPGDRGKVAVLALAAFLLGVATSGPLAAQTWDAGVLASTPRPRLLASAAELATIKQAIQQKPWVSRAFNALLSNAQAAAAAGYGNLPPVGSSSHLTKANGIWQGAVAGLLGDRPDLLQSAADGLVTYARLYPTIPWGNGLGRLFPSEALPEAEWLIPLIEAYDLLYDTGVLSDGEKSLIETSLIRLAMPVFKIDDYATDPRAYQLYKYSNHHAYHTAVVGLAGLALGDASLVDWAVNHPYGFRAYVGHALRDDGAHWERSMVYTRFTLAGMIRFTEAAYRCGLDLYSIRTEGMANLVVANHYSTDVTALPKGLRMAFEALAQMRLPNGDYPLFGDGNSYFWRGITEPDLVGLRRYRTPMLAWHAERNNLLDPGNGNGGPAFGFLHQGRYRLQYSNLRLGGQPVKWTQVNATYTVAGDGTVSASDGGATQPGRYLTGEAPGADYVLQWNLKRVDSLAGQTAYVVFRSHPDYPGNGQQFRINTDQLSVGRDYAFRLELSGPDRRLYRDGVLISSSPVLGSTWYGDWRTMLMLAAMGDPKPYQDLAREWTWADGTFANSGQVRNGSSLLPSTGVAVLREKPGENDWQGTVAALSFGSYGGGHGHAAQLGMVMYSGGRQWIRQFDSMRYGTPEKGRWTTQTISHNTVVVGRVSQNPVGTSTAEWPSDSAANRVQGRLVAFDGARQRVEAESEKAYPGLRLRRVQQLSGHHLVDDFTVEPLGAATSRNFDYVLHIEGKHEGSSFELTTTSGALGTTSGYQFVQKKMSGTVSAPGWLRYAAGSKQLKVWVVPTPGQPVQLILGDGPSESTNRRVSMLILNSSGPSAAFTTVLEEGVGPMERLASASLTNNQLSLNFGARSETITLGRRWGTVTPEEPPNSLPVARADTATTTQNTAVSGNLAANDTASGDGGNVWSRVSGPANGTATVSATGAFTYTPATNFTGTDSFTYTLRDANGDGSTATVTVTVTAGTVNSVPVAVADAFTTPMNTVLNGNLAANDTLSSDGNHLWWLWSTPTHGVVTINKDGTFAYTPTSAYTGSDRFTYALRDGTYDRSNAEVKITVTARTMGEVPVAVADTFTMPMNTVLNGNLGVNDELSSGGGNHWYLRLTPAQGTVMVNGDGTFLYTPTQGYTGSDRFVYGLRDATYNRSIADVLITVGVGVANSLPVARADSATTARNTTVSGNLAANDTASGDGGNVWSRVSGPANGTVILSATGTFTYTPAAEFTGTDTFTYTLRDADGDGSTATVTISVMAGTSNGVPMANADTATVDEDVTLTGNLAANDLGSRDGGNVWSLASGPKRGSATVHSNGTYSYRANWHF